MVGGLRSPYPERAVVIAWKGLARNKGGYRGGRGLVRGNAVQYLSQAGAIALPVGGTAKHPVPKAPKRTDFFAAIQAGQTALSESRFTAAVTLITS